MYMTKEADYAVRIVSCVASAGRRVDAKYISDRTSVTLRFALKILRKLVESGVIKSFKGKNGGYELAKEPGRITLGEVIRTVDGPFVLSRCVGGEDPECLLDGDSGCRFRKIYSEISDSISRQLDEVTFDRFENIF